VAEQMWMRASSGAIMVSARISNPRTLNYGFISSGGICLFTDRLLRF
jgi:hypothetical protein